MARKVRNYVLFTNLEPKVQNTFKVTQLLGGDVGIHLLVYLITKALALSTILSFNSHHGSPKYKEQIALSMMSFNCQLIYSDRHFGLGKENYWLVLHPISTFCLSVYI